MGANFRQKKANKTQLSAKKEKTCCWGSKCLPGTKYCRLYLSRMAFLCFRLNNYLRQSNTILE